VAQQSEEHEITKAVKRAIEGDTEAYSWLYSLYVGRIYRYVFYHVGNKMAAEDITEEVFLKSWKSLSSCKGKEQTFSAWLYRIAHNHLVDTFRKSRKEVPFTNVDLVEDEDPQKEAEDSLELQRVLEAVKRLPEPQKQVILLKFFEDNDNAEISRILGKRKGAVRALQMRALNNLRERFNPGVKSNGR
jgi:RNA polymerase sigma-70 factor (ECF subfamily)